jgi:outer membrane lipoprotein-sorting protein
MRRTLFALLVLLALAAPAGARQQVQKAAPKLSAEQILEKFVEASGGRQAFEKHKSMSIKGTVEVVGAGISGPAEIVTKAPDKIYSVVELTGFGVIRQGYDGKVGWSTDPLKGTQQLGGAELALLKREASVSDLDWRKTWKSVELTGTQDIGGRSAYVLKLTPNAGEGGPITNFYDAETFLVIRSEMVIETAEMTAPVVSTFSDFRTVDGVKMAFVTEQKLPTASLRTTFSEVTFDVPVDDAKFAMPK